jgi:predicted ATPase
MPDYLTLYDLRHVTDYLGFESLCHDIMSRAGYKDIQPLGTFNDLGRDAVHVDKSTAEVTIFTYSVREDWKAKLTEDLNKIKNHNHKCDYMVFVTTSEIKPIEKQKIEREVPLRYRWKLEIYDLYRIATLLDNHYPNLKQRHPGIFRISSRRHEQRNSGLVRRRYRVPPLPRNRLVGRDQDLAKVCEMLLKDHIVLLTLTGPPGTGKTRLSLQAAASLTGSFADGVVYVELSSIRDGSLVVPTLAQALGIKEKKGRSLIETIKTQLVGAEMLLVLDNFEHVISAAPEVESLILSCHSIKVLVTSRRSLNLSHEHEFQVQPLSFPNDSEISSTELSSFSAIQLFLETAQAVDINFNATKKDHIDIARICSLLDGLPLAIELASARIKVFKTPAALLKQLVDRSGHLEFSVLTDGAVNLDPRQRALEATIGWSYDLLNKQEKKLLRQLSVFAGGCTLNSAEAVSRLPNVFTHIAALVDWNLLVREEGLDAQPRFALLETIREYALKRLAENSDEKQRTEGRHANYFFAQAKSMEQHLPTADMTSGMDWFKAEQDNLRKAMSWALAHNGEMALWLAYTLSEFWNILGHLTEERTMLNRALETARDAPEELQMRVLGRAAGRQSNPEDAKLMAERHLELSRKTKMPREEAWALHNLGNIARLKGNLSEGRKLLQDAITLFRQQNDETGMALALLSLGVLALDQEDFSSAQLFVTESLALSEKLRFRGHLPIVRTYLAFIRHRHGKREAADELIRESLEMLRQDERQSWLPWGLQWKGRIALERGELETARQNLTESLRIFERNEDTGGQIRSLLAFAYFYSSNGAWRTAVTLLEAEQAQREQEGSAPPPDWKRQVDSIRVAARERLETAEFAEAAEVGKQMSLDQAVAYAMEELA